MMQISLPPLGGLSQTANGRRLEGDAGLAPRKIIATLAALGLRTKQRGGGIDLYLHGRNAAWARDWPEALELGISLFRREL